MYGVLWLDGGSFDIYILFPIFDDNVLYRVGVLPTNMHGVGPSVQLMDSMSGSTMLLC